MLAPPRRPCDSPPGRPASALTGPGRLLQAHFLPTNPLALANEGCPHGHKRPKTLHSAHRISGPSPSPSPRLRVSSSRRLAGPSPPSSGGRLLGPCAGWRTYLDSRFWDSRLTSQVFPGGNPREAIPHEGLHKDPCLGRRDDCPLPPGLSGRVFYQRQTPHREEGMLRPVGPSQHTKPRRCVEGRESPTQAESPQAALQPGQGPKEYAHRWIACLDPSWCTHACVCKGGRGLPRPGRPGASCPDLGHRRGQPPDREPCFLFTLPACLPWSSTSRETSLAG